MRDLAAINAALRLGDPAVPPNGTIVELYRKGSLRFTPPLRCCVKALRWCDGESGRWVFAVVPCGDIRGAEHHVLAGRDEYAVVELPAVATPFEQWDRGGWSEELRRRCGL